MKKSGARLHPANEIVVVLEFDGLLVRRTEMPLVERVDAIALVVGDELVDDQASVVAVGQLEQVRLQVGLARIHEVDLFGELFGEGRLAGAEVAVHRDYQAVLAELAHSRVGYLAPQAVALVLVVVRLVVAFANVVERERSRRYYCCCCCCRTRSRRDRSDSGSANSMSNLAQHRFWFVDNL